MNRREEIEEESHKQFPCELPCDSYGVCDNCIDSDIFRIGAEWADANPAEQPLIPRIIEFGLPGALYEGSHQQKLAIKLAQTKAALDVAVEALKNVEFCPISISSSIISDMQETATKALAKIAELQKEKTK